MTGGPARAGFDARHYAHLAAAEDRHFWFTSRNQLLARVFQRIAAALPAGACALEIGTGTGNTLRVVERAAGASIVVGMDLFDEGFEWAARRCRRAHLVRGSVDRPPFRRRFDLVAALDVLEHVESDRQALQDIKDLLTPSGWLVLTVPAFRHLWSAFDEASHHCRRYERDELQERLRTAGFRVEQLTFAMATLYPAVRVVRAIGGQARGDAQAEVARELRVVPGFNLLMKGALAVENAWLGAGRHLPFGTSLLAVARPL